VNSSCHFFSSLRDRRVLFPYFFSVLYLENRDFLLLLLHSRTLSLASEAIDNPWETAQACYRFMRWVGVSLVAAVFRRGVCATIREIRAFVLHFLQEARSNSDWIRERELKEHNRSRGRSWEWSSLGSSHAGSAPGSPDPEPLQ
jgi:hypothetical protein